MRVSSPARKWQKSSMVCRRTPVQRPYDRGMQDGRQDLAVVTGGGRGLGRAFAKALAHAGAKVVLAGRTGSDLDQAVDEIGAGARGFVADVTDAKAIREMFREIGPVDVLVNNAGVLGPIGPFAECDFEDWWRASEVNLRGLMLCTHAALGGMMQRRRGRIINIVTGAFSAAHISAYLASKTAVVRATECLAMETKEYGISLFSFAPGTVKTDMSTRSLLSPEGQRWIPWFKGIFDEGLTLEAESPAAMVAALASGKYDALSGLYLTAFDDLDEMLRNCDEIRERAQHKLQIQARVLPAAAAQIAKIRAAALKP